MGDQHWPEGLTEEIAVLNGDISILEKSLGISFSESFDDLDYYRYRLFDSEIGQFALMRYRNAPLPGLTLVVYKSFMQRMNDNISVVLKLLSLTENDILWKAA